MDCEEQGLRLLCRLMSRRWRLPIGTNKMDAKITSLVNLNTGHIEDLTKTPGEEYDLIWLNQNELFLYHAPHSPDLPDVLQVWNTKEKNY